jgi:hypothetical protein
MLLRQSIKSNEVRVPTVARGEAVIVERYSKETPKVALVNPEDLEMLEEAHDLLLAVGTTAPLTVDELTLKTRAIEDRPEAHSVEDPAQIDALLGL